MFFSDFLFRSYLQKKPFCFIIHSILKQECIMKAVFRCGMLRLVLE